MNIIAVVQARVGSTRLPGKVMYPLDGQPTLEHVVRRTRHADTVSDVVVATSTEPQDDVIEEYAPVFGASVVRGSESNVLDRFTTVIERFDPEIIVRVTGDCPLLSPEFVDASVNRVWNEGFDYACAGLKRTFPRGVTCEAFTVNSFEQVKIESSEPHHREHVTPYYRENPDTFALSNIESDELFEEERLLDRTDLRLTLDEPSDYRLLETIYREVGYEEILDLRDAIEYIDKNELAKINDHVHQKSVK